MHVAVEGIFRDGKVELLEDPPDRGEARVIVTFLSASTPVDLADRGHRPRAGGRPARPTSHVRRRLGPAGDGRLR